MYGVCLCVVREIMYVMLGQECMYYEKDVRIVLVIRSQMNACG